MRRVVFFVFLASLCGCGSCLEDKKVPQEDQAATPPVHYGGSGEGGIRRRLDIKPGINFSDALKDAAAPRPSGSGS